MFYFKEDNIYMMIIRATYFNPNDFMMWYVWCWAPGQGSSAHEAVENLAHVGEQHRLRCGLPKGEPARQ